MGAARSNMLYCRVEKTLLDVMVTGRAYAGIIHTRSVGNNIQVGMEAGVDYEFLNKTSHMLALVYRGQVDHYQKDFGGFSDQGSTVHPGGYFSPHLYVNNIVALAYRHVFPNDAELTLQGGPSLQYVKKSSGETSMGTDLSAIYVRKLKESLYIKAEGNYLQVADIYRRFTCTAVLTWRF